ncbi:MAG: cytochrome C [Sulfurospirillaceae bacterium]|nr:cytochrome C [Sulfurospirillaceae bacterium]MDD2825272.1 cytochrome C [Sulfurospirillaceae bacterium]
MKKVFKLFWATALTLGFLSTSAYADIDKGQKIYSKQFKTICGFSGNVMAQKHKQAEWHDIFYSGKLNEELIKECPNAKKLKNSDLQHVYDFLYNYALDSGNRATC